MNGEAADTGPAPTRRDVLRVGVLGMAGAAAGAVGSGVATVGAAGPEGADRATAATADGVLDLYVNEGMVPMVDGTLVYMRGFGDRPTAADDPFPSLTAAPRIFFADGRLESDRFYPPDAAVPPHGRPSPAGPDPHTPLHYRVRRAYWGSYFPPRTIIAESGGRIRLRVHNTLRQRHELAFSALAASTGPIEPGATAALEFDTPEPGTYLFTDPGGGNVQRTLGLFGVLVVVPRNDRWRLTEGGVEFERQWVWICHDIDPEWARRARAGEVIDSARTPPVPRYFTLNGRSGYESLALTEDENLNHSRHEETLISGSPRATDVRDFSKDATADSLITGQLLRVVNAGVVVHQIHFHGNHVWTVRRNGQPFGRTAGTVDDEGHIRLQQWEDVVELDALDVKESVLPIKPPPDGIDEVFAARTTDWQFPMHCHAEPSQTAGGGLYPGGLVGDWILVAPLPAEGGH